MRGGLIYSNFVLPMHLCSTIGSIPEEKDVTLESWSSSAMSLGPKSCPIGER
jgi:hypothetical protein